MALMPVWNNTRCPMRPMLVLAPENRVEVNCVGFQLLVTKGDPPVAKKQRPTRPILDEATRQRVLARRQRKSARRAEREAAREAERLWYEPAAVAARTAANTEVLANDAWITVSLGVGDVAGLLPPADDGSCQPIFRSGALKPLPPFSDARTAVFWLLEELLEARGTVECELLDLSEEIADETAMRLAREQVDLSFRSPEAQAWYQPVTDAAIQSLRDGTLAFLDQQTLLEAIDDPALKAELDAIVYP